MEDKSRLIFEKSRTGRGSFDPGSGETDSQELDHIPKDFMRKSRARLPEVCERDVISHFIALSQKNMSVDTHFYPLGSCTMKYNPKVNEDIAAFSEFRSIHPCMEQKDFQGLLALLYEFEGFLCRLLGFDAFTLQPAAGAHGELTALMMARKYFHEKGEEGRRVILVPDSSHGTNPASALMCGFDHVITVKSNKEGEIDIDDLRRKCTEDVACLMVTNPNTLGLFERQIKVIADILHGRGALLYGDGANMNALMGIARPGDMGFDFLHINLHKTFSAPHGGGGPGSGPVGVKDFLKQFLPGPLIRKENDAFLLDDPVDHSIGSVRVFYGNLSVVLKAICYVKSLGFKELKRSSQIAVLNARYLMEKLKGVFPLAYDKPCMHEFVLTVKPNEHGVHTVDVAKALIDRGIHPPTVYFPLIVKEAIMIEPTETESPETLERFISTMKEIAEEIDRVPGKIKESPKKMPVRRLDEVTAAKHPVVNFFDMPRL